MLSVLLSALVAQATPLPSPPMPPACIRDMQGAVLFSNQNSAATKGPAPYYAVVEMHINADDSIKFVRIYKSSGIAAYDQDALTVARALLTMPSIAHCKQVETDLFYLQSPKGYTTPTFSPHP